MRIASNGFTEIVSFADPASGKTASSGAKRCRTAIVTIGQLAEGEAFLLEAVAGQWPTDMMTAKIFETQDRWHPTRFGVEANAQQRLWVDTLLQTATMQRKRMTIVPVEQPTNQTKEFRITTEVQKWLHNGLLYINEACTEAKKEIEQYPKGQTCDIVDAIASALHMLRDPFANPHGLVYEVSSSYDGKGKFDGYHKR